jgi:hypothetical protein
VTRQEKKESELSKVVGIQFLTSKKGKMRNIKSIMGQILVFLHFPSDSFISRHIAFPYSELVIKKVRDAVLQIAINLQFLFFFLRKLNHQFDIK